MADDTAAMQRALDELVKHEKACVLYVPAGTYRITDTVNTVRKAHTDCQGVSIVGEDPARTVIRWDGPEEGTMVAWDAWYSKISRLALGNQFWVHEPGTTAATVWLNKATPPARGGVDDATVLRHLAPLREVRAWLPADTRAKVTDVRIHRLMASGGCDATVEFRSER